MFDFSYKVVQDGKLFGVQRVKFKISLEDINQAI